MSNGQVNQLRLNGGKGTIDMQVDGTLKVTVTYQLGFGLQMPPGTLIVIEEAFVPKDEMTDERQAQLLQLAEKWKTKDSKP